MTFTIKINGPIQSTDMTSIGMMKSNRRREWITYNLPSLQTNLCNSRKKKNVNGHNANRAVPYSHLWLCLFPKLHAFYSHISFLVHELSSLRKQWRSSSTSSWRRDSDHSSFLSMEENYVVGLNDKAPDPWQTSRPDICVFHRFSRSRPNLSLRKQRRSSSTSSWRRDSDHRFFFSLGRD